MVGEAQEVPPLREVAPAMEVEAYEVRIVGVRPLLVNRPRLSDVQPSGIPSPEREAREALYADGDIIVVPSINVKAMLRDAGMSYRIPGRRATYGACVRAGIIDVVPSPNIPLLNPKTNKPYRVSGGEWKVDVRPVVVQGSRVLRARPRFDEWALEFEIANFNPGSLKEETIFEILAGAGRFHGLGDFRPEFGLFKVEKFNKMPSLLELLKTK
jgi:hypothetical protein